MTVLIIDNNTSFLGKLINMAEQNGANQVAVMDHSEIDMAAAKDFDLIILSGGHGYPVVNHEVEYANELELIKSGKKILGICLGCELIAYAFGSRLELLPEREKGLVELEILESDPIVAGLEKVKVHESHRWYIKQLSLNLKALAKSKDGIEIIKHSTLPIYGLQFHPELDQSEGGRIIQAVMTA